MSNKWREPPSWLLDSKNDKTRGMINWSTDEEKFKKENPKEYKIWRLSQLINYGLDGEKLDTAEVWEDVG